MRALIKFVLLNLVYVQLAASFDNIWNSKELVMDPADDIFGDNYQKLLIFELNHDILRYLTILTISDDGNVHT